MIFIGVFFTLKKNLGLGGKEESTEINNGERGDVLSVHPPGNHCSHHIYMFYIVTYWNHFFNNGKTKPKQNKNTTPYVKTKLEYQHVKGGYFEMGLWVIWFFYFLLFICIFYNKCVTCIIF